MPKRTRRKSSRPPPARRGGRRSGRPRASRGAPTREPQTLLYKVVELSTVDEASLEQAVNRWVREGWHLENVQFAMRESSKRPSMAFVFLTRAGRPAEVEGDNTAARERLLRLAGAETSPAADEPERTERNRRTWSAAPERAGDPWRRLEELAGEANGEGEEPR